MDALSGSINELDKSLLRNMVLLAINDIKVNIVELEKRRGELLGIIRKNRVNGEFEKEKEELRKTEEKIDNRRTAIKFFKTDWGQDVCEAIGLSASMIKAQLKKMGYM